MGELINGRTPEEIITGLKCEVACSKCAYREHNFMKDDTCSYYVEQDVLALIKRLEAERDAALAKVPKWISVKEQPPKENTYYMVSVNLYGNRGMYTDIAMFDGELWVRDAGSYFDILDKGDITHFMPLPELAKEDQDGE